MKENLNKKNAEILAFKNWRQLRQQPTAANKVKSLMNNVRNVLQMFAKRFAILEDEATKPEYKKYLNKLTKIKPIAKKQYFTDELEKIKAINEKLGKFCDLCFHEN